MELYYLAFTEKKPLNSLSELEVSHEYISFSMKK